MATTTAGHEKVNWGLFGLIVAAVIVAFVLWTAVVQPLLNKGQEVARQTNETIQKGAAELKDDISREAAQKATEKYILETYAQANNERFFGEGVVLTDVKIAKVEDLGTVDAADAKARALFNPNPIIIGHYPEADTVYYWFLVEYKFNMDDTKSVNQEVFSAYKKSGEEWAIVSSRPLQ